jgi:hypothetical protein
MPLFRGRAEVIGTRSIEWPIVDLSGRSRQWIKVKNAKALAFSARAFSNWRMACYGSRPRGRMPLPSPPSSPMPTGELKDLHREGRLRGMLHHWSQPVFINLIAMASSYQPAKLPYLHHSRLPRTESVKTGPGSRGSGAFPSSRPRTSADRNNARSRNHRTGRVLATARH